MALPILETEQGENFLTELLSQCYAAQNPYGDKAGMFAYRDAAFRMLMGEYPCWIVRWAFLRFLRTKRDLPTPSDIIGIIEADEEAERYMRLVRWMDGGGDVSPDAGYFMQNFEKERLSQWH